MSRVLAAGAVGAVALALAGCFRDSGGGCAQVECGGSRGTGTDAATSSGGEGTSTGATTAGADATTGPGLALAGPAFRVSTLELIDPRLYDSGCAEVTGFLNLGTASAVGLHDTNALLVAMNYDPAAKKQEFQLSHAADCPVREPYCVLLGNVPATVFFAEQRSAADCFDVDLTVVNPDNVDALHVPKAPCTVGTSTLMQLQLVPELGPITLFAGGFAARYHPDKLDPGELRSGVFYGFLPQADAEQLEYEVMGTKINLWRALRGSDDPASCPVPMDGLPGSVSDVDVLDLDGDGPAEPTPGVFLHFNFTAKRVDAYAPL